MKPQTLKTWSNFMCQLGFSLAGSRNENGVVTSIEHITIYCQCCTGILYHVHRARHQMHTQTEIHTQTQTYTHRHTQTHTLTQMYAYMHECTTAHTYKPAHTHTHIIILYKYVVKSVYTNTHITCYQEFII